MLVMLRTFKLTTYRPLLLIFVISCVLLAAFTYTLYHQARDNQTAEAWTTHTYEVIRLARMTTLLTVDMETGQRGYLLTGAKEYLEPYRKGRAQVKNTLQELEKMVADNVGQQKNVADIRHKLTAFEAALTQQIAAFDKGQKLTVADLDRNKKLMDMARLALNGFVDNERLFLASRIQKMNAQQHEYFITLILGAALLVGALMLANLLIIGVVSKSRETELELAGIQAKYRLLLESLNDGTYELNPATGDMSFSDTYARMLGYEPTEIEKTQEGVSRLVHPEDLTLALERYHQYANHEAPTYSSTFRMRHKNGEWRWILSRGAGTFDADGKLVRLLGIHTDVTEHREREEALKQSNKDMEGFIYIVSHDLRSPLVNIKGFTAEVEHALKETMPLLDPLIATLPEDKMKTVNHMFHEEIPEALAFIRSGVDRMDTLTTSILDLSRIGRREYRREAVDTKALVKRCLDSMAYEIATKSIETVCDDLPIVQTDPVALEQVFANIIENAIKYLPEGRKGIIAVRARALPWETVFSIQDNGRGIAPQDRQKVFDIFRRASNAGEVRGAGMGMALVKAVLRRMGGKIWFESTLGEGTTFYFSIPTHTNLHASKEAI